MRSRPRRARAVPHEAGFDDEECVEMMTTFIAENPTLWSEDIGVED